MEHDALIDLGLDDDGAIARIAQFPTLHDAWEGSNEPSDMIWIAARICRGTANAQLIGLMSMVLAGNLVTEDQPGLRRIQRQAYGWLEDPEENILANLTVAANAVLHRGQETGLEVIEEGDNCQVVFDGRHHTHMFMWQSLRATSLLYAEDNKEAANKILSGWQFLPQSIRPNAVKYLRSGLDVDGWFADWLKKSAVGEG